MMTIISNSEIPVTYLSCGNLQNDDGFLHKRRTIDSFVLIMVRKGTLYITQNNISYEINAGEFIVLLPFVEHFGTAKSKGELSYDWLHFVFNSDYKISDLCEAFYDYGKEPYLIPIIGSFNAWSRLPALFCQLLDFSMRGEFPQTALNYCASTLLLLLASEQSKTGSQTSMIFSIQQWIRANYSKNLSLNKIAEHFHYNPDYLSNLFIKETGESFTHFLHRTRIQAAKNLLIDQNITIKEAAYSCGFHDEKYFMRIFKQLEHITPGQYRDTFNRKHINSN